MSLDLNLILQTIIKKFEGIYFALICTENGVIKKAYINEEEFNASKIGLNISMLYESAEELTTDIGLQKPDFSLIHSQNFYIISIKVMDLLIIILCDDQIQVTDVFTTINECIAQIA